jgi:hypothetical protein
MVTVAATIIEKSGPIYLIHDGKSAQLHDSESDWTGPIGRYLSVLAHCNVQDEWEGVEPKDVPQHVRRLRDKFDKSDKKEFK